jgi:ribonuclease D|tara:strand:+ start:1725 stop:2867 length:1143 start_codon:yes stop_codon:yes gene_type:complete
LTTTSHANRHPLWIDRQADLDAWIEHAESAPWLGVDTEFERVRTFFPRLCLLQMATPDQAVCIDPLADLDWDGIRELITQSQPTKIFHAARQDLEVLHHYLSVLPTHFFDTQMAGALCGYGEQVGYAQLVKEICNVSLPKAFTRTPWCRRPLGSEEIQYALDDVHYLGILYQTLHAALRQRGRLSWLADDCAALVSNEALQQAEAAPVNRVLRACAGMDWQSQSVAAALTKWREDLARRKDRPREWMLSTDVVVELARSRPKDLQQLAGVPGLEKATLKRRGEELLEIIRAGESPAPDFTPVSKPGRPDPRLRALGNAMWKHLGELCEREGLPTSAVAPRDEIRALAAGERDLRILSGWRRKFVGESLLALASPADTSRP